MYLKPDRLNLPGDTDGWRQVWGVLGRDKPLLCSDLRARSLWVGPGSNLRQEPGLPLCREEGASWVLTAGHERRGAPATPEVTFAVSVEGAWRRALSGWAAWEGRRRPLSAGAQPHTAAPGAGKRQTLLQRSRSCIRPRFAASCMVSEVAYTREKPCPSRGRTRSGWGQPGEPGGARLGLGTNLPHVSNVPRALPVQVQLLSPGFPAGNQL